MPKNLANPGIFENYIRTFSPWLGIFSIVLLSVGLWFAIFNSPIDYIQGETVRIMYIHVPSAWLGMMIYSVVALSSFIGLIYGHIVAYIIAKASAPIGAVFTLICLVSGSSWGKPMWGTWWVWDARLTSVFILFFFFIGFIIFSKSFKDPVKGEKISSILALVGFINIPIIKFSVDFWNTLHQPASISKLDNPTIHVDMMIPLFLMFLAFLFIFMFLLTIRLQAELNDRRYVTHALNVK